MSAWYNYTEVPLNGTGTNLNVTGEYEAYRNGDWLWATWLFWTNLLASPLAYLPAAIVISVFAFIGYMKNRSIIIPAIWFMFFSTVIGITFWAAIAPYIGFIALGVVVMAIVVAYLKTFYG